MSLHTADPRVPQKDFENYILLRIKVEGQFLTLKVSLQTLLEDILREVVEKFSLDYELYTIQFADGKSADMDRNLEYYQRSSRIAQINVVKGEKLFTTMSIFEDDLEVLVLDTSKAQYL